MIPERPNITYALNKELSLFIEGGGRRAEYEVHKDNLQGAVLEYKQMHLGAGLQYKVNKFIRASVTGGGIFGRTLKYTDSQGKVNIKNASYLEFRLEIML